MSQKHLLAAIVIASATAVLPKLSLLGLSNNNWGGGIDYRVRNAFVEGHIYNGTLRCSLRPPFDWAATWDGDFTPADGQVLSADLQFLIEQLCFGIPKLVTDGLPPRTLAPGVEGPWVFGRLI